MADARLLEKYNNLVFFDPRYEDTYTVFKKILSSTGWTSGGIAGGWALILVGVDEDDNEVGSGINKVVIGLIAKTAQAPGVELFYPESEDNDKLDEEYCWSGICG